MKSLAMIFTLLAVQFAHAQRPDFKWLTGTWKLKNNATFEIWKKQAGSENLVGKAFRLQGSDTVVTETIKLEYYNGSFHYIPDVAGDQPPVDFTITKADSQSFVAENPRHDFPKIIRYSFYTKDGRDRIEASIEGDGKVIPYSFEKIK